MTTNGRICRIAALLGALAAGSLANGKPARAQVALELNRLEPRDGGACRVWLVAGNQAAEALDPLRLDLVLFGQDGVILRRIAIDLGPIPAARTAVRTFDLGGQVCDSIGQVLMNDVLACGGARTPREACADRITLRSRAMGVEFHK